MNVYLHIGSPKTGTTSLKSALGKLRPALAKRGILYPVIEGPSLPHHPLILSAQLDTPSRIFLQRNTRPEALKQQAEAAFAALAEQTDDRFHTTILSSEVAFEIGTEDRTTELLNRLREIWPHAQVEIVCYLRAPLPFFLSSLGQLIRADHRLPAIEARDYLPHLNAFHTADRIHVHHYETTAQSRSGIVAHFLQHYAAGLAAPEQARENTSLSAEALFLLWDYRRRLHPDLGGLFRRDSNLLYQRLLALDPKVAGKQPLQAKPWVSERIQATFQSQTDDLYQKYGICFPPPDLSCPDFSSPSGATTDLQLDQILVTDSTRLNSLQNMVMRNPLRSELQTRAK